MAKKIQYFSHDCDARNDIKLKKVFIKLGHEGKSVFWDLIEILYQENGKLILDEIDTYAHSLGTSTKLMKALINNFGLFVKDKTHFWSESANNRINEINSKSEKAKNSALNRWEKHANAQKIYANALQSDSESNAINNNKAKVNENKIKEDNTLLPDATLSGSVYKECIDLYNNFIIERTGVGAKINQATGSAMKKIISYLKTQIKNKDDLTIGIPNAFGFVLTNYDKWDKFHQQQLNLNQIEINLINILNSIRNGKSTTNTKQAPISKYAPK